MHLGNHAHHHYGCRGDFALYHLTADVVLRTIGVALEYRGAPEPLEIHACAGEAFSAPVECNKVGFCRKNAVKTPPQLVFSLRRWIVAIVLDVGVKPPDAVSDTLLCPVLLLAKGIQLV